MHKPLTEPVTEIEAAEISTLGEPIRNIVGRLIFERDILRDRLAATTTLDSCCSTLKKIILDIQGDTCKMQSEGDCDCFICKVNWMQSVLRIEAKE